MRPSWALRQVPRQEQSAHTVSQRIRTLKRIPPELIPLGAVIGIALIAAGYSIVNKSVSDKTLRWGRKGSGGHDSH